MAQCATASQPSMFPARWSLHREGTFVRATFIGFLDPVAGEASAQQFAMQTRDMESIDLIFEVSEMSGYDNAARAAWGSMMKLRRRQIRSLTTRGANTIVRLGTSLLGMLAGVQVEHH